MTDTDRMLECLKRAGSHGVHSHDLRRWAITGNPSQRAADLEAKGYEIERERENKGKRPGTRYRLLSEHHAARTSGRVTSGEYLQDESAAKSGVDDQGAPTLFELEPPSQYDPFSEAA